jgi:hypothetical protein
VPLLGPRTTLVLPACIGVSLEDQATGDDEPFVSLGARLDIVLPPGDLAGLTLSAGVNALLAGRDARVLDDGDESDAYAFVTLALAF